jgi:hypothetical protein
MKGKLSLAKWTAQSCFMLTDSPRFGASWAYLRVPWFEVSALQHASTPLGPVDSLPEWS